MPGPKEGTTDTTGRSTLDELKPFFLCLLSEAKEAGRCGSRDCPAAKSLTLPADLRWEPGEVYQGSLETSVDALPGREQFLGHSL